MVAMVAGLDAVRFENVGFENDVDAGLPCTTFAALGGANEGRV